MKKAAFDPNAPLPDDIFEQFMKETEKKEKEKEEPIELPDNIMIADPKIAAKTKREKAQAQLQKMLNRDNIRRTNYGTVMNDRSKVKGPSVTFAAGEGKK